VEVAVDAALVTGVEVAAGGEAVGGGFSTGVRDLRKEIEGSW
jgi:hypothetical protein